MTAVEIVSLIVNKYANNIHVSHGCRGGMPLVVAGGPCMGQCKVRRVADDDNPCG